MLVRVQPASCFLSPKKSFSKMHEKERVEKNFRLKVGQLYRTAPSLWGRGCSFVPKPEWCTAEGIARSWQPGGALTFWDQPVKIIDPKCRPDESTFMYLDLILGRSSMHYEPWALIIINGTMHLVHTDYCLPMHRIVGSSF